MHVTEALKMARHFNPKARLMSVHVDIENDTINAQIATGLPIHSMIPVHDSQVMNSDLEAMIEEFTSNQQAQKQPQTA